MDDVDFNDRMQNLGLLIANHQLVDNFINEYQRMINLIKSDIELDYDEGRYPVRVFRLKNLLINQALWMAGEWQDRQGGGCGEAGGEVQ